MTGDVAQWASILNVAARESEQSGQRGWLVGGCLRDVRLGLPVRDIDLAVTGEPLSLAEALKEHFAASIAPLNTTTVRVVFRGPAGVPDGPEVDISALHGADIEDDLRLRDFRVNALALPLAAYGELLSVMQRPLDVGSELPTLRYLVDPLDGVADLQARVLRLCSAHALMDDPGRIVRAARLIASHGFKPSPEVVEAARVSAPQLRLLPPDRLREEMNALVSVPHAWQGLALLAECGALTAILGDDLSAEAATHAIASVRATESLAGPGNTVRAVCGDTSVSGVAHLMTLDAVRHWCQEPLPDRRPRLVALRWGLMLHAVEEVATSAVRASAADAQKSVVEHVPLAAHTRTIVRAVVSCGEWREHLARRMPSDTELRSFFADAGDAGVDVLLSAVACADAWRGAGEGDEGKVPRVGDSEVAERARSILARYFSDREWFIPPPLLSGSDVIHELGVAPGPGIKSALQAVRSAQLDGTIGTREQALEVAERHLSAGSSDETDTREPG